ncbi:kinase-like domain-containing protein [Gautieria morchelliformis]|nr:kinase-like domain-containing protein [Gautieria morchelliformis]
MGDVFAGGRYKVLHKLGFGGSSTVWLAQDQLLRDKDPDILVILKVMSAEQSSKPGAKIADLYIPQEVEFSRAIDHPGREHIHVGKDQFLHEGPNGVHCCPVSQSAGPSLLSIAECPGRVSGSRRLRGELTRMVARQVAIAMDLLYSAGIIHGDLTSSNILFRVANQVHNWSMSVDDIYGIFGSPKMEELVTRNGSPPGPLSPSHVVAPIDISVLSSLSLLKADILLIDFCESFFADHPPPHYEPTISLHYLSPEGFFDPEISFASDVWALACIIFGRGFHALTPSSAAIL